MEEGDKKPSATKRGDEDDARNRSTSEMREYLIGWNCDVLADELRHLEYVRSSNNEHDDENNKEILDRLEEKSRTQGRVLEQVVDVLEMRNVDYTSTKKKSLSKSVELNPDVYTQLRDYVTFLGSLYRENPFHSFTRASHAAMSLSKYLSRIEKASSTELGNFTKDPLTRFAMIFAALIQDVDHRGVVNEEQLIEENPDLAKLYKNRCITEQNSFDLAWDMLMQCHFRQLRHVIYKTPQEFEHFRNVVINCVVATNVQDGKLQELRKARWERLFGNDDDDNINEKATAVMEALMQATEIIHAFQHWFLYQKWDHRLFREQYVFFQFGRIMHDPGTTWYQQGIEFLETKAIPLAKQLKQSGVFASSEDYLTNAIKNLDEWSEKGEHIVAIMVEKHAAIGQAAAIASPQKKSWSAQQA